MPAFSKVAENYLGRILSEATVATKETYPQLLEAFEALCEKHHILHPPELLISSSYPVASALVKENKILAGDFYLAMHPPETQLFMAAHETVHIMAQHGNVSVQANEFIADRLGAHLVGSNTAGIAFRKESDAMFKGSELIDPSYAKNWFTKKALEFHNWSKTANRTKAYGTLEQQIKNFETPQPNDQALLDQLISQHNQRFSK